MLRILFFLFFCLHSFLIEGKESFPTKKKYTLSICAVLRNEAKYVKEWIEFHRLIGVDHFYLYNNNSTDRLHRTLSPYLRKGLVTLIDWPDIWEPIEEELLSFWALSTQIPAYENAIKYTAYKETKWLALLTTDEFLLPVETYSMKELLAKCDKAPGVLLESDVFDASNIEFSFSKKLMIETTELTKAPKSNPHGTIAPYIVKPEKCAGFTYPPYKIEFVNDEPLLKVKRLEMRVNRYINRGKLFVDSLKRKLNVDPHRLSLAELTFFLDEGYAIEDPERAIYRYVPDLKLKCFDP